MMKTPEFDYIEVGQYNGYVAVPPGHPLSGVDYNDPRLAEIDVHGGLTFADTVGVLPAERMEAVRPNAEPPSDWWAFGFDTCHSGDTPEKWNRGTVEAETRILQVQLEALAAAIEKSQDTKSDAV